MAMDSAVDPAKSDDESPPLAPSLPRDAPDPFSESSSSAADTPDHTHPANSSPNPLGDSEIQSPATLRSEEYRQLFRLPIDEVLIEDFNCACQENILIQGHMYLFLQHICFYSNIFGYETKKTIPLCEITGVKRAKTAGIFPNAIEIIAGGKKHFFGSFLSRDEAFKLINEGWLRNSNDAYAITEQVSQFYHGLRGDDGIETILDPNFIPTVEDDTASTSISELKENVEHDVKPVVIADSLSSRKTWAWKEENSDAPKIPEYYTMVAESKFARIPLISLKHFTEDVVIKISSAVHGFLTTNLATAAMWNFYIRSKYILVQNLVAARKLRNFGCTETGKLLYSAILERSDTDECHLVIESSQDIIDVPYGDYFRVEALWDIQRDSSESTECCYLRVYVNVAFSKKTVFKGKIVQSTMEECREVYGIWISMAHELLKKINLEKLEGNDPKDSVVGNSEVPSKRETRTEEPLERKHVNQVGSNMQGNPFNTNSVASVLREPVMRFWTSFKTHGHFPPLLVITFVVIILMQLSILMLLARPQKVYVISPAGYVNVLGSGNAEKSVEVIRLLEKRIHHLKDEMLSVEMHLERMRHEHDLLKAQLKDLRYLGIHG